MTYPRTNNKAIDWLIGKAEAKMENQSDVEYPGETYFVGTFTGNLNYHMAQEVKAYANRNAKMSTSHFTLYLTAKADTERAEIRRVWFKFGTTRNTNNRISFNIDHETFENPTTEEIVKINAMEIN